MGGYDGVVEALARWLAGVAQGCPASAMVFCIVAEIRALLALVSVPQCWGLGGLFNRLGYIDTDFACFCHQPPEGQIRMTLRSPVLCTGGKKRTFPC